jgi:hypothetical protein
MKMNYRNHVAHALAQTAPRCATCGDAEYGPWVLIATDTGDRWLCEDCEDTLRTKKEAWKALRASLAGVRCDFTDAMHAAMDGIDVAVNRERYIAATYRVASWIQSTRDARCNVCDAPAIYPLCEACTEHYNEMPEPPDFHDDSDDTPDDAIAWQNATDAKEEEDAWYDAWLAYKGL